MYQKLKLVTTMYTGETEQEAFDYFVNNSFHYNSDNTYTVIQNDSNFWEVYQLID
jgi:hypothetical protein